MTDVEEICEWFDGLSEERQRLIVLRITRALEDVYDSDGRIEVGQTLLELAYWKDRMAEWEEAGAVQVIGVSDHGGLEYKVVE
jgi:hypothetical protein